MITTLKHSPVIWNHIWEFCLVIVPCYKFDVISIKKTFVQHKLNINFSLRIIVLFNGIGQLYSGSIIYFNEILKISLKIIYFFISWLMD